RLMFEFCVDLWAYQIDDCGQPSPCHEADGRTERSVCFIVAAKVCCVPREQQRSTQPDRCSKYAAGRNPTPLWFVAARTGAEDQCDRKTDRQEKQGPTSELQGEIDYS